MRETRFHIRTLGVGVAGAFFIAGTILLSPLLRSWYQRWGATQAEVERTLPGDELIERHGAKHGGRRHLQYLPRGSLDEKDCHHQGLGGRNAGMVSLILLATFAAVCLLTYGIFAYRINRRQIQDRFKKPKSDPLPVLRRMDKQNKVRTRFIEWTSIFGKYAIKDKEDQTELSDLRTTLIQAGFRHPGAPAAFFGIRVILAIVLPAISMGVLLLKGQPNTINLVSTVCLAGVGYYCPEMY